MQSRKLWKTQLQRQNTLEENLTREHIEYKKTRKAEESAKLKYHPLQYLFYHKMLHRITSFQYLIVGRLLYILWCVNTATRTTPEGSMKSFTGRNAPKKQWSVTTVRHTTHRRRSQPILTDSQCRTYRMQPNTWYRSYSSYWYGKCSSVSFVIYTHAWDVPDASETTSVGTKHYCRIQACHTHPLHLTTREWVHVRTLMLDLRQTKCSVWLHKRIWKSYMHFIPRSCVPVSVLHLKFFLTSEGHTRWICNMSTPKPAKTRPTADVLTLRKGSSLQTSLMLRLDVSVLGGSWCTMWIL